MLKLWKRQYKNIICFSLYGTAFTIVYHLFICTCEWIWGSVFLVSNCKLRKSWRRQYKSLICLYMYGTAFKIATIFLFVHVDLRFCLFILQPWIHEIMNKTVQNLHLHFPSKNCIYDRLPSVCLYMWIWGSVFLIWIFEKKNSYINHKNTEFIGNSTD